MKSLFRLIAIPNRISSQRLYNLSSRQFALTPKPPTPKHGKQFSLKPIQPGQENEDNDENLIELEKLNAFIQGTSFEQQLDKFFDMQMQQGKSPEDIYADAVKNNQSDFNSQSEKQDFDPSKITINKDLLESFQQMMEDRQKDPQMQKMYEDLMKTQHAAPQDETLDDEEMEELEQLKNVSASDSKSDQQQLNERAKNIFGKK